MAQPVIPSFPDIKDGESLARIEQYLVKLQRQLKYQFSHIDESNLQDGAITEKKLSAPILREIKDAYGNISGFRQAANQIALAVSNGRIFKADTEAALLSQLLAANIPMTEGLIWFDTTENLIKRCSVVSPLAWETLQTGEMHISGIDIEPNRVRIYSTSELLLEGATADLDTAYFRVHDGEKEIISATSEGVVVGADSIVANKYIGPVLGTYPGGTFPWQGSFAATFGENGLPKYLITETTVNVPAGTYNEDVVIQGYTGATLIINIAANTIINGSLSIISCASVEILGASNTTCQFRCLATGANSKLVGIWYTQNVILNGLMFSGYVNRTTSSNGTYFGVYIYAARAQLYGCQIERVSVPIYADVSNVLAYNCRGGMTGSDAATHANLIGIQCVTAAVMALNGMIPMAPNAPTDNYAGYYGHLLGSGTPTTSIGTPAAPSGDTVSTYAGTAYGRLTIPSSATFSNWSTYSPRQGGISAEDYWGIWILPAIADYASATQAKVTVTRGLSQGSSGAVTVNIRGHGQTAIPGGYYTPTTANGLFTDYGMSVSLERGASATILLPTAALNALKAGTLKGFGLTSYGNLAQMAESISLEVTT